MSIIEFICIISISGLILISLIVSNILLIKIIKHMNQVKSPIINNTYKQLTDELMSIVTQKAYIANQRIMQPLVDKAIDGRPMINDKVVNRVSALVTKEILDEMSPEYFKKITSIYNQDKIEDIILELVYNVVTEMALTINRSTIKRMHQRKRFRSVSEQNLQDIE